MFNKGERLVWAATLAKGAAAYIAPKNALDPWKSGAGSLVAFPVAGLKVCRASRRFRPSTRSTWVE
jgi:hypothetical protein